ncbi:MAG: hypothetical protein KA210_00820 [Bacteroidia bacterium]|nr:hypothetical protein [Bacteroidia bacterium]
MILSFDTINEATKNTFKDISSATACRDLKKGIDLQLFECVGKLNKTKYSVKK